jgi:ribonuclease BN (tRNA processing enzyme)
MKIRVLGAFGGEGLGHRPSAFLVNEKILLDGGSVSGALTVDEQLGIEHAIVSHAHLDHIAGLVYLTETLAFCEVGAAVTIASIDPVITALRTGVFNDTLWPDFSKIPRPDAPVVKYRTLAEDVEQRVGDLWVTPIAVSHTVPAAGFIVHDGSTGVVYSGDTGPTDALWRAARNLRGLRAVILECAFPNRLGPLGQVAKHMTPATIRRELDKLPPDVPVWIFHVKPQFHAEVAEELAQLDGGRVSILEQDRTYSI